MAETQEYLVSVVLKVQSTSQEAAEAEVQNFMEKQLRLWFGVGDETIDAEFREVGQGEVTH